MERSIDGTMLCFVEILDCLEFALKNPKILGFRNYINGNDPRCRFIPSVNLILESRCAVLMLSLITIDWIIHQ